MAGRELHWLRVRGHAIYDRSGAPSRMAGISLDITERKAIEESLREETHTLESSINRHGAGRQPRSRAHRADGDRCRDRAVGRAFRRVLLQCPRRQGRQPTCSTRSPASRARSFSNFPMPRNTDGLRPDLRGQGDRPVRGHPQGPALRQEALRIPACRQGIFPVVSYLAVAGHLALRRGARRPVLRPRAGRRIHRARRAHRRRTSRRRPPSRSTMRGCSAPRRPRSPQRRRRAAPSCCSRNSIIGSRIRWRSCSRSRRRHCATRTRPRHFDRASRRGSWRSPKRTIS